VCWFFVACHTPERTCSTHMSDAYVWRTCLAYVFGVRVQRMCVVCVCGVVVCVWCASSVWFRCVVVAACVVVVAVGRGWVGGVCDKL